MVDPMRTTGLALVALSLTLSAAPAFARAEGTTGNDVISGNGRSNHIMALGGRDRVTANGGNDTVIGALVRCRAPCSLSVAR